MAVKIRLKRLGKVRVPQYRIVVVDSRKKRDGKVIEEIGKYHPKEDPSLHRGRLRPGAVLAGRRRAAVRGRRQAPQDHRRLADLQGLPGTEGTLKVAEPKRDKLDDLQRGAQGGRRASPRATPSPRRPPPRRPTKKADDEAETADEEPADEAEPPRTPAAEAPGRGAPAEVPAAETPEAPPPRPRRPRPPTSRRRGLSA